MPLVCFIKNSYITFWETAKILNGGKKKKEMKTKQILQMRF